MAIKKIINGKEEVVAEKSIVDHSQLTGREAYGAHPISAIRKLPEKLHTLKQTDEKLEKQLEENSKQLKKAVDFVVESNLEINETFEKSVEEIDRAVSEINEVKDNLSKVGIEVSEDDIVSYTGINGDVTSFKAGNNVDNDTIAFNDNKEITIKKVYSNEDEFIGNGTSDSPLELKNKVDNKTIIIDEEVSQIYSGGLRGNTEDEFISYQDIINTNEENVEKFVAVDKKIEAHEKVTTNQQEQINELKARTQGIGGYLAAYNFKSPVPNQADLNDYALTQIPSISNPSEIFNGTKVKNLYDNTVWVFTNTPAFTDENGIKHEAIQEWAPNGKDTLLDANNDGVHGLVTGSYEHLEGFIDLLGHISINGLDDELTNINKNTTQISENLTTEISERKDADAKLKTLLDTNVEKLSEANSKLKNSLETFIQTVEDTYETKEHVTETKKELSDVDKANREISFKWKGEYNNNAIYEKNDVVKFGKYYYLSMVDVNDKPQPNVKEDTENWFCLSRYAIRSENSELLKIQDHTDDKLYLVGNYIKDRENWVTLWNYLDKVFIETDGTLYDNRGQVASDDRLTEVKEHAEQINLKEDTNNKGKLLFTNYNGDVTSLQGGFLPDEETITLNDNNKLVAARVIKNDDGTTILKVYATQEELDKISQDLKEALDIEIENRKENDKELNDKILAEAAVRKNADDDLTTKIEEEESRATTAEQALSTALADEIAEREAGDRELNTALANEIKARTDKDTELQTAIEGLSKALSEKVILRRWN